MELSPGVERFKIRGQWIHFEESGRGQVSVQHPDGRTIFFEMDRDLKERLSWDPDPEFKAWRTEMERLREKAIKAARKAWG